MKKAKTLTEPEAAAMIGIHPETLARLRRSRKIPSWRKIGRLVKYLPEDVDRAIASFQTGEAQESSESNVLKARFG